MGMAVQYLGFAVALDRGWEEGKSTTITSILIAFICSIVMMGVQTTKKLDLAPQSLTGGSELPRIT